MARMDITQAPAASTYSDVEKLNLEAGEKARLYMVEGASWLVEYTHELRHKAKPTKAQEAAGMQSTPQDFYGNFLCLGDPTVLQQNMPDSVNCPFCREISSSDGKILPAKAAFATNIIRYATPKSSHELTRPAQVKLLAWIHRDDRKRRVILELQNEWSDLTQHDVLVTCNNAFQQYDISVAARTAFAEDQALANLIREVYDNNKYSDDVLTQALGRRVDTNGAEAAISSLGAGSSSSESAVSSAASVVSGVAAASSSVTLPAAAPVAAVAAPVAAPVSVTPPIPAPVDLNGLGVVTREATTDETTANVAVETPPAPPAVELPPLTPPSV